MTKDSAAVMGPTLYALIVDGEWFAMSQAVGTNLATKYADDCLKKNVTAAIYDRVRLSARSAMAVGMVRYFPKIATGVR